MDRICRIGVTLLVTYIYKENTRIPPMIGPLITYSYNYNYDIALELL
jgi:hypothetical protein